MASFGVLNASRLALRAVMNKELRKYLNQSLLIFFSTTGYSTVSKSLVNSNKQQHTSCLKQSDISILTFHTQFNAYHALNDDYNFDGEVVETKKEIVFEKGKKIISATLQKELRCTKNDAETMLKACYRLTRVTRYDIAERIQCFLSFGINATVIVASPWLLTIKLEDIPLRVNNFKAMGLEFEEGVYLLKVSTTRLQKMAQTAKGDKENRFRHLSELLDISVPEVCEIVAKHSFLYTMPYERLREVMNILKGYNITHENILKDLWVFRYDPKTIETRLKKAADVGYPNIKPWLVHCTEKSYERSLERKTQVLDTLGPNGSVEEYLSHRLDCSCENVIALYRNYPLITTVHINKMKDTLDYLFAENFTATQIKHVPRILCHSLDTIRKRLAELRQLGHPPSSLYTLCLSKRQFAEHIKKVKSRQSQDAVYA